MSKQVELVFPNIGQGNCAIFKNNKHGFMLDSGGERQENFKSSIKDLDTLESEISHYDGDHCLNLINLLNSCCPPPEIKRLFIPEVKKDENVPNYFKLKESVHIYESIVSVKEIFTKNENIIEEFVNGNKEEVFNKFHANNEFEKMCLTLLIEKENSIKCSKRYDPSYRISQIKNILNESDEMEIYEKIAEYSRNLCNEYNISFQEIEINYIHPHEKTKYEIKGIGALYLYGTPTENIKNENQRCPLAILETCNKRYCSPGDCPVEEQKLLAEKIKKDNNGNCEILIAPHHGGKESISDELMEVLKPRAVVIQAEFRKYFRPREETIDKFIEWDVLILKQEKLNEITFTISDMERTYVRIENIIKQINATEYKNNNSERKISVLDDIRNKMEEYKQYIEEKFKKVKNVLLSNCCSSVEEIIQKNEELDEMNIIDKALIAEYYCDADYVKNSYLKDCLEEIRYKGILLDKNCLNIFISKNGNFRDKNIIKSCEEYIKEPELCLLNDKIKEFKMLLKNDFTNKEIESLLNIVNGKDDDVFLLNELN